MGTAERPSAPEGSPNNDACRRELRRAALGALTVALDASNPLEHSHLAAHVLVAERARLCVPLQEIVALRFVPGVHVSSASCDASCMHADQGVPFVGE
jgi:hypothetical protein